MQLIECFDCALILLINKATSDQKGRGGYDVAMTKPAMPQGGLRDVWNHEAGQKCFERTIDPKNYPPYPGIKTAPAPLY